MYSLYSITSTLNLEYSMCRHIFLCDWFHMGLLSIHGRCLFWIIFPRIVPHIMLDSWIHGTVPYIMLDCTSYYLRLYIILCGLVPYIMWDLYLILCRIVPHFYMGLYLILCGIVPHCMWDCTSYFVGLYLILCGIVPIIIEALRCTAINHYNCMSPSQWEPGDRIGICWFISIYWWNCFLRHSHQWSKQAPVTQQALHIGICSMTFIISYNMDESCSG